MQNIHRSGIASPAYANAGVGLRFCRIVMVDDLLQGTAAITSTTRLDYSNTARSLFMLEAWKCVSEVNILSGARKLASQQKSTLVDPWSCCLLAAP